MIMSSASLRLGAGCGTPRAAPPARRARCAHRGCSPCCEIRAAAAAQTPTIDARIESSIDIRDTAAGTACLVRCLRANPRAMDQLQHGPEQGQDVHGAWRAFRQQLHGADDARMGAARHGLRMAGDAAPC